MSSIFFPYSRMAASRPGLDLRDDGEAVVGGRLREGGTVSALLELEESLFRDRHRGGLLPVGLRRVT